MDDIFKEFDNLKYGLTHSKRKKSFYDLFDKSLGKYPTLALLGLHSRANVSLAEIEMIAHIAKQFTPIKLDTYNTDLNGLPNVCFTGVFSSYEIRFEMQFNVLNPKSNKDLHPDLKVTIVQHFNNKKNDVCSVIIEYEGHSSHIKPEKVKSTFLRNRELTYQTLAPILPYYQEELKSAKERSKTIQKIKEYIEKMISTFEKSAEFARKKSNYSPPQDSGVTCCPVCEGAEKLGSTYCPACGGAGVVRKNILLTIDINEYLYFKCNHCKGEGCFKCHNSGSISREKAIEIAQEESLL